MPPPPLNPARRYFPPSPRRVYWVPVIASPGAPARAELNAGTDLTAEIPEGGMTGWSLQAAGTVDVHDICSGFTSALPLALSCVPSSIDFYLSQNSIDARTLLPRGSSGNVVIAWEGDVAGGLMDVFPAGVLAQEYGPSTEDPGKVTVRFAARGNPATAVTIPGPPPAPVYGPVYTATYGS